MITSTTPVDWRDLQRQVAEILEQCGMAVELEKTIDTVRGVVDVDVHAVETVKGRRLVLLAECKHWGTRVPKQIIHGFRTVVADSGANVGYIVSSSGFQSGAFTAAELTNVMLLTWAEFQGEFEEAWLEHHMLPTVADRLDKLFTYTEPLVPRKFLEVDDRTVERLKALRDQYGPFAWLMMTFTPYLHAFSETKNIPALPLRKRADESMQRAVPAAILAATGYREALDAAVDFADTATREFDQALAESGPAAD